MSLQLYDSEELLGMPTKVATGYLVLMGGAGTPSLPSNKNVSFLALVSQLFALVTISMNSSRRKMLTNSWLGPRFFVFFFL
jgi:hypothetical protein